MSEQTQVLVEMAEPGVATITLDGPRRRNSVGNDAVNQLEAAVRRVSQDDCRVVVLTGAHGFFCSGGDLKGALRPVGTGVGAGAGVLRSLHQSFSALRRLPMPTIAAVEGGAIGVGWSLALTCDMVIAAQDAIFVAPFVDRGTVPDGGLAWLITQAAGAKRAASLMMLPEKLPASEAATLGLVSKVVPSGHALDEARGMAQRLARGPRDALALTKRTLIAAAQPGSFEDFCNAEWLAAALAVSGPEFAEGTRAFRNGRAPDFAPDSSHRSGTPSGSAR
jgi:2-(1,2-epoxy-1,2-dihydrophenyl)acetyl-CoA isomerase